MYLVRNLGMHNQWKVDEKYIKYSINKNWNVGDFRNVTIDELTDWNKHLHNIFQLTSSAISNKFDFVPPFPLYQKISDENYPGLIFPTIFLSSFLFLQYL